jgi:uncharacterized membrane protein YfcA
MDFELWQWVAIVVIFIWTGFVRTGIGFGGAALGLPLLLLVEDQPLFFLPIIATHLLIITSMSTGLRFKHIDWAFVKYSMSWMLLPKIAGVIGLLSLPNTWLVVFVFIITALYAISWLIQRELPYQSKWTDRGLLLVGGYVSGVSLVGAPLIATVAIRHVAIERYRDTLFVLWFFLVAIKMSGFVIVGQDLQTDWAFILLAPALIGHFIGMRFHKQIIHQGNNRMKRFLGGGLLVVSFVGLLQTLL